MTVHGMQTAGRGGGVSGGDGPRAVPMPPALAVADLERALTRFENALTLERDGWSLDAADRKRAAEDRRDFARFMNGVEVDAVYQIDSSDVIGFLHHVTGCPAAWIAAWQYHSFRAQVEAIAPGSGLCLDILAPLAEEAAQAFEDGFNKSYEGNRK